MSAIVDRFVAVSLGIQEAAAQEDFETLERLLDERETSIGLLATTNLNDAQTNALRRADDLARESINRHLAEAVSGRMALKEGQRLHSALRAGQNSQLDMTG